jgi:hypothetical protein
MKYTFLLIILLCMQQIVHGAAAQAPEIMPYAPFQEELAKAKKELQVLAELWVKHSQTVDEEDRQRTKEKKSTGKKKPTEDDLSLLLVACQYRELRETYPQLPKNKAIEFFIDNSTVNGHIKDFRFNNPYSPATVTEEPNGAYHATVDWKDYPVYAQVELCQENYDEFERNRSSSNPVTFKPAKRPNRAERGLSLPAYPAADKPVQGLRKADSGYASKQLVPEKPLFVSWQRGNTWFAEV